ncbi:leucine-rich repeat-containing protein 74A [Danio rerio]|uniref:Leucine-rich repeat-containing protein 74A n=1 Tax=Danio rerio TaxID=7955 RepID=A0A8M3B2P2_DANRE|nr:leucine-rich repeat-containing protein 74A isoform X2 [Danio rerio]|eukprot:XP_009291611.2 leucine-rich repeat-containing protein 74A isoform X2 [Danio rerio]
MKTIDSSVHSLSLDSLSLTENEHHHDIHLEDEDDTESLGDQMDRFPGPAFRKTTTVSGVKLIRKDLSTEKLYLQACKLVGVIPVRYFIRNLGCATINLNHHGLGPLGGKALAIALVTDMHTTTLELADNCLRAEGATHLMEMLRANFTIHNLDLSDNQLQSAGAESVAKMLLENISIKSLKLSGNKFTEDDAKWFADALSSNYRVKELDLSHNEFSGRGGEHLGQMIANNDGLEVLDLSWNHLRMKGAVAFCAGLKVNTTLKHLDLSWNGFGNEGALALGEALKFNNTLQHLDLNNNRITDEGAGMLSKGLEANDTLRVLQLAYNSLTVEGALTLINTIKNTPKSAIEDINICNVLVNENFVQLLDLTCQERPSLEVQYGGVGGFIAKKPRKRIDPMKIIQDYLDQRKLRLWDFFRNIDKDGTMRVPVVDFRKAVQQSSIPLERFQIEELIQRLDRDRTGVVDYRGLADTRKQMMRDHRRQLRKVESRQKKEKQKSERILKTFESAVEAVTPRSSMIIISPKEDSSGPQPFSATPLSSWHHIIMSTSSRYSDHNMSSEHVHLPMIGNPPSSPGMRSYSQPNLFASMPKTVSSKPASAQGIHSTSNPSVASSKLSPIANLTRSRPALHTEPSGRARAKGKKKKKTKKTKEKI